MIYNKKCKIVLLESENEPVYGDLILRHIWKNDPKFECRSLWQYKQTEVIGGVKQYTTLNGTFRDYYTSFKTQYLYVLSNDKIRNGNWIYHSLDSHPIQYFSENYTLGNPPEHYGYKKIIATTNSELWKYGVAKLDPQFLRDYCKREIDEALVEYYEFTPGTGVNGETTYNLKTSSRNSISIKPIEETWSDILEYARNNNMDLYDLINYMKEEFENPKRLES